MHRFFSKPETLLRLRRGTLADYLDRYADWLSEQGFCRAAARLHLAQIADFSLWLDKQGLTLNDVQPPVIDSFIEDRRRRVKPHAERSTLQRFLRVMRPESCSQASPPLTASQVLLQDFRRHFLEERGAAHVSYLTLQPILHQFLSDCFPGGTIDCAADSERCVNSSPSRLSSQPRPCQVVGHSPARLSPLLTPAQRDHERSGSLRASCGHVARINYPEVPFFRPSSPSASPVRSEQCHRHAKLRHPVAALPAGLPCR